jgi:hypothetical protein
MTRRADIVDRLCPAADRGDKDARDAIDEIVCLRIQKRDAAEALAEERDLAGRAEKTANELAARLDRVTAHLHRLADFAYGNIADPWPDPAPAKRQRRKA